MENIKIDTRLKNIFKKLNIDIADEDLFYFEDAQVIGQINISQIKKKAYIVVQVKNFIPTRILKDLNQKFKAAKVPTKISFDVKYQLIDQDLVWDYLDFIKNVKAQIKGGAWNFVNKKAINFNDDEKELLINVESSSQKKDLETEIKYIDSKLKQYGFKNLNFKVEVIDRDFDYFAKQEQEYQDMAKKYVNQNPNIESKSTEVYNPVKSSTSNYYRKNAVSFSEPSYEKLSDLEDNAQNIVIHASILNLEIKMSKTGRKIYLFGVTDFTSSIKVTYFAKDNSITALDPLTDDDKNSENFKQLDMEKIHVGDWIALKGKTTYSPYEQEMIFIADSFQKIEKDTSIREDKNETKRVELHTHSKMSVMDGVSDISEYIKKADKWGWNAIALTDHINVQAFPDAFSTIKMVNKKRKEKNIQPLKMIYGSEITMLNDDLWYVKNPTGGKLNQSKFVVFDLETTGLSPEFDEIIEFGAVTYDYKTGNRKKIDILIKPEKPLKNFTKELTHITDEMLEDKPTIKEAFAEIYEIINDAILVAHNANFDFNFLNSYAKKLGYPELKNTVIDTLTIARSFYPELKNHRLGTVAKRTGILYDDKIAHRGDYDADVLTDIYEHMWSDAKKEYEIILDTDWNKVHPQNNRRNMNYVKTRGFHTTILAKNQKGLKELYKLISDSHTQTLYGSPKIFQKTLSECHQNGNLLFGTSCVNGEIFELARTNTIDVLNEKIKFYDYVEIQPLSVYKNLLQNDSLDEDELIRTIKVIMQAAKDNDKPIVATSDAHYTDPELKMIREIYINAKGLGGVNHPLYDFKHRVTDFPDQFLRTTQEMLDEFSWLNDPKLVEEIVITNTNKIAEMIDFNIQATKSGTYNPNIDNVNKLLRDKCYETAHALYGKNLPKIVVDRLEKELNSIFKHGFAVIYWISHKLVEQSLNDGYLVGSRGSVGSSFVATMSNITEVNPLKPHYRCPECQYSDFNTPAEFKCGYDLPEKKCPECQTDLIGDGHDIPFETFLGFDGDKVPDIDLNFSGEYQPTAHNFTKTMFGEHNVFRAGTISTVADKTAFGYVKGYFEQKYDEYHQPRKVEVERLAKLAAGVKRTTGQHPGGIIILPNEYEIEDFTPVNYPADDINANWKTTHFDFHSIHDNLLKMDILGHVDPTALKMLRDLTGVDPKSIPTNDKKVYSLFSNLDALNIKPEQINNESTGAIGIPEFGTQFVRGMLKETKPSTFADLVQISGLSHGTDVWLGNAQTLIKQGKANISTVIGCRDDIMVYLMSMGLDSGDAFAIMESVRKGKGLTSEWIEKMKAHNVPDWYIEACLKIKYMFPKAHATAYVLMAYRVAWYKIYYPVEYYATFFSTRADAFDLKTSLDGYDASLQKLREIEQKIAHKDASKKEMDLQTTFEVVIEMMARGVKLKNIDFNKSLSTKFLVEKDPTTGEKVLYPPFNVIDSLGEAVAKSIVDGRSIKPFSSINDLKSRTQITQTQMKIFQELKITDSLSNDEQLTFEF